jgi:hypothetical protein
MRGNVKDEHPSAVMPRVTNGVWKLAFSKQITASHKLQADVTAAPTAGPLIAANNGFGNVMKASKSASFAFRDSATRVEGQTGFPMEPEKSTPAL